MLLLYPFLTLQKLCSVCQRETSPGSPSDVNFSLFEAGETLATCNKGNAAWLTDCEGEQN